MKYISCVTTVSNKMENNVFDKRQTKVRLNVGGVDFKCYTDTLARFEGSLLAGLDRDNEHYDENDNEYFFDRNPLIFQYILDGYRTGSMHIPGDMCGSKFKEELEFWGISESLVSRCCWEALYKSEEKVETVHTLEKFYGDHYFSAGSNQNGFRNNVWQFLHEPKSSCYSKVWSVFISCIIAMSVMVSAFETVSFVRTGTYSREENATLNRALFLLLGNGSRDTLFYSMMLSKPSDFIPALDSFCFVVLTIELVLVFCCSPNRKELFKCWLHMSEIVCSVAFWIYFICERNIGKIDSIHLIKTMMVCKYLTILKLVRLFRIARHIPALKIMGLTIWVSKYELFVLGLMLFILTSLFGLLMYLSESVDNDTFINVFAAMYWALITMTTIGYGDYVPSTLTGHVIASVCAVCGIIMLALPIGIFASNFNNLYHHHQYVSKHTATCTQDSGIADYASEYEKGSVEDFNIINSPESERKVAYSDRADL